VSDIHDRDQPGKKKRPLWFKFHVGDIMADTAHLTREQFGAYITLLSVMWRTDDCTLPNDESKLARYSRVHPPRWKKIWPAIKELFEPYPEPGAEVITRRDLWQDFGIAERNIGIAAEKGRKSGEARAAVMNRKNDSMSASHGASETAPNPMKNNDGALAGVQPTQHNRTEQNRTEKRREEKDSSFPNGNESHSEKEKGLQERRGEILKFFYQTLPLPYHDSFTEEILEQAIEAEMNGRNEGLILLAHHHERKTKEKGNP
jgi:uncharacterized protein YdaU (DUF1376 family)